MAMFIFLLMLPLMLPFQTQPCNLSDPHITFDKKKAIEKATRWKERVYLATFPRSGNHWVRYLVEEATRIATSSVYMDSDPIHLPIVFPWGGYCCDHGYEGHCTYARAGPVIIKTHFPVFTSSSFDELPYKCVIRIIRHPVDSFYSFYVFQFGTKSADYFIPHRVLSCYIKAWRFFQDYWDRQENVITIRYEDLYKDPATHLKLILEKSGYQVRQQDIDRAVKRYPAKGGLSKYFHHFKEEDIELIRAELGDSIAQYGYEL